MPRLFIGIGSNLGDRIESLRSGVTRLRDTDCLSVVRCSSVYETEPVGKKDQGPFLNAVVECASSCEPGNLLSVLREIERQCGRKERGRWEPRELDLDILFYGDLVLTTAALRIPHPEVPRRRFVLEPLSEIAPRFPDPLRGNRVIDMLRDCPGSEQVTRIKDML